MDYFNHGPFDIITLLFLWKIIWWNSNKPFVFSYSSQAFPLRVGKKFWQIEWFSSSDSCAKPCISLSNTLSPLLVQHKVIHS
jgi:hypothetical protein